MDISIKNAEVAQPAHEIVTSPSLSARLNNYLNSQAQNRTYWFILSLITQGVLFLPIPSVLIYYFNAPVPVVIITYSMFFANVIAGMGGAGIKTLIYLFAASAIIHILLLAGFALF